MQIKLAQSVVNPSQAAAWQQLFVFVEYMYTATDTTTTAAAVGYNNS